MGVKVSLVMATYGRFEEVANFFESLMFSNYPINDIEVIVVDQNETIELSKIVKKYEEKIKIIYIRSDIKGLSKNRNIGLKYVSGDIVAFPDDDCEYLPDTLVCAIENIMSNNFDMVLGRIVERDGSDSLRTWSTKNEVVTKMNFYKKCSSITMFYKIDKFEYKFNENLGVGEKFGACEDADFIYQKCKRPGIIQYIPELKIYHPHYTAGVNMNINKIKSYGLGFGAMIRKNLDLYMLILFIKAQGYHLLKGIIYLVSFKFSKSNESLNAFKSRLIGFINYKKSIRGKYED